MTTSIAATHRPIAVGVEDSEADETALAWSASEATLRGLPLRLVYASELPLWLARDRGLQKHVMEDASARSDKLFDRATARIHDVDAELTVESHLRWGSAAAVLLNCAREAALVVVGSTPRTGRRRVVLHPVASHVAAHAPCPVIVARTPEDGREAGEGKVVVGVDGSRISEEAVRFAFEEAAYRRTSVIAVLAWEPETHPLWPVLSDAADSLREDAEVTLAESVAGWRERYPDVALEQRVVRSHPVQGLLDVAPEATLMVAGSHGRGWFPGMLLGSVSNALIRSAPVTLAVVRTPIP